MLMLIRAILFIYAFGLDRYGSDCSFNTGYFPYFIIQQEKKNKVCESLQSLQMNRVLNYNDS